MVYLHLAEHEAIGDDVHLDLDALSEDDREGIEERPEVVVMSRDDFELLLRPQPLDGPYLLFRINAWREPLEALHELLRAVQWWHERLWPRLPKGLVSVRLPMDMRGLLRAACEQSVSRQIKGELDDPESVTVAGYPVLYDERVPIDEVHFVFNQ